MKIVVWSGGADSTLVLHDAVLRDAGGGNVRAITLIHDQMGHSVQRTREEMAREKYKAWAKSRGLQFTHDVITVSTEAEILGRTGQATTFLSMLFPYFPPDTGQVQVQFAYIRTDDFWHYATQFRAAFMALRSVAWADESLTVDFPLEWVTKREVLEKLDAFQVPSSAWWTCDDPATGARACGKCGKCKQVPLKYLKDHLLAEPLPCVAYIAETEQLQGEI